MPPLPFPTRSSVALVAVGDPGSDRTVYATIVLLVALGFAMILLAVWLLRTTRPDPEVLAPLERMGQRKWRRADPVWQRRHLDEMRPGGADPLEPSSAPPATDADFERGPQTIGFEDLASDAPSVGATADLPAPSGAPLAVAGSLDVERADELTPGEGTAEVAPDVVAGEDAGALTGDGVVEGADGSTDADADDDDEDITGEQDTDDFLAVLDRDDEPDSDIDMPADPDEPMRDDPRSKLMQSSNPRSMSKPMQSSIPRSSRKPMQSSNPRSTRKLMQSSNPTSTWKPMQSSNHPCPRPRARTMTSQADAGYSRSRWPRSTSTR